MQTALYVWILERPEQSAKLRFSGDTVEKEKDFNILVSDDGRTGQLQKKYAEMVISSIQ